MAAYDCIKLSDDSVDSIISSLRHAYYETEHLESELHAAIRELKWMGLPELLPLIVQLDQKKWKLSDLGDKSRSLVSQMKKVRDKFENTEKEIAAYAEDVMFDRQGNGSLIRDVSQIPWTISPASQMLRPYRPKPWTFWFGMTPVVRTTYYRRMRQVYSLRINSILIVILGQLRILTWRPNEELVPLWLVRLAEG